MRTSFLLLSAALALAACDDAAETTGPRSASVASVSDVATALPPGPSDAKKPAAFTTITVLESSAFNFAGVGSILGGMSWGIVPHFCPAGTKVIGGGYEVAGANPLDLKVLASKPVGNSWQVSVEETGSSLSTASLKVTVICIG
jgi:hypothetical protein